MRVQGSTALRCNGTKRSCDRPNEAPGVVCSGAPIVTSVQRGVWRSVTAAAYEIATYTKDCFEEESHHQVEDERLANWVGRQPLHHLAIGVRHGFVQAEFFSLHN